MEVNGKQIPVDDEGYLQDPDDWSMEIAGMRKPLKLLLDL